MFHYSQGDLKLIINELSIEDLNAEDSGSRVFRHVKEAFAEYVDKNLPKVTENALVSSHAKRTGDPLLLPCQDDR